MLKLNDAFIYISYGYSVIIFNIYLFCIKNYRKSYREFAVTGDEIPSKL